MNIGDIFTVATAYIRGFLCVRIFKIDLNLYQSGHLHGAWSLKALKKHNVYFFEPLEKEISVEDMQKIVDVNEKLVKKLKDGTNTISKQEVSNYLCRPTLGLW